MGIVFVGVGGVSDIRGAEEERVGVLFELAEVILMNIKYVII